MRSDMQKVITERERYGSSARNRKAGKKIRPVDVAEDDDEPKRLSRAQLYGTKEKSFSDVLNPLRRFLRKNVGRPWNKVYSEICEHLDDRSIMGRHLFDHLSWEVDLHPTFDEHGKLCDQPGVVSIRFQDKFYVHPRTGLLCFAPKLSRRERQRERDAQREVTYIRISDTASLIKIGGIWHHAEYQESEPPPPGATTGEPTWHWQHTGSRWFRQKRKWQCTEKDLRARGLVNSPTMV